MRVLMEIDPTTQPVCGWIEPLEAERMRFTGMLELLTLLGRVLATDGATDTPLPRS